MRRGKLAFLQDILRGVKLNRGWRIEEKAGNSPGTAAMHEGGG